MILPASGTDHLPCRGEHPVKLRRRHTRCRVRRLSLPVCHECVGKRETTAYYGYFYMIVSLLLALALQSKYLNSYSLGM